MQYVPSNPTLIINVLPVLLKSLFDSASNIYYLQ